MFELLLAQSDQISSRRSNFIERQPRNEIKKQTNLLQNRQKMTEAGGEGGVIGLQHQSSPATPTGEFQCAQEI